MSTKPGQNNPLPPPVGPQYPPGTPQNPTPPPPIPTIAEQVPLSESDPDGDEIEDESA